MKSDSLDFCQRLAKIYETGLTVDDHLSEITVRGMPTLNNLIVIRNFLLHYRWYYTLEIGLAFGGSALTILTTLTEVYQRETFQHSAIDPYQYEARKGSALKVIALENFSHNFRFFEQQSNLALPKLLSYMLMVQDLLVEVDCLPFSGGKSLIKKAENLLGFRQLRAFRKNSEPPKTLEDYVCWILSLNIPPSRN